jgi:hypothetical protein
VIEVEGAKPWRASPPAARILLIGRGGDRNHSLERCFVSRQIETSVTLRIEGGRWVAAKCSA